MKYRIAENEIVVEAVVVEVALMTHVCHPQTCGFLPMNGLKAYRPLKEIFHQSLSMTIEADPRNYRNCCGETPSNKLHTPLSSSVRFTPYNPDLPRKFTANIGFMTRKLPIVEISMF